MKYTTNHYANIYSLSLSSRGLPKSCQVLFIVH